MKTNKGFVVPLLLGVIALLVAGGVYYRARDTKTCPSVIADCKNGKTACYADILELDKETRRCIPDNLCEQCDNIETNSNSANTLPKTFSETEIISSLKTNWPTLQASFKNRPGHPGTVSWSSPDAVQFIGKNHLLIRYEDGYISSVNILSYENEEFKTLETFNNHGLFSLSEWQDLVKKYGNLNYPVSSYSINAIRNNEIISFEKLTKVPENVFVKNLPVVSGVEKNTYTYKNHGFTLELPKGFVPQEEQSEGGPSISITLPNYVYLSYWTDASWWQKYSLPEYFFIKEEVIGTTTFKVYYTIGKDIIYWFQQGNVGYEFSGQPQRGDPSNILKTFKFVGWAGNDTANSPSLSFAPGNIIFPNGGEQFNFGQEINVKWGNTKDLPGQPSTLLLLCRADSTVLQRECLGSSLKYYKRNDRYSDQFPADTSSTTWQVGTYFDGSVQLMAPSGNYKIFSETYFGEDKNIVNDISDAYFTIK